MPAALEVAWAAFAAYQQRAPVPLRVEATHREFAESFSEEGAGTFGRPRRPYRRKLAIIRERLCVRTAERIRAQRDGASAYERLVSGDRDPTRTLATPKPE